MNILSFNGIFMPPLLQNLTTQKDFYNIIYPYLYGMIWEKLYSILCDWRILKIGLMFYYWNN